MNLSPQQFEHLSRQLFTDLNTEAISKDVILTIDFDSRTIRNVLTEKELSLDVALDQLIQVKGWYDAIDFLMEEYFKILSE
jgi:hypothetical protein